MDPENIDLNELARPLATRFSSVAPAGYVRGKGDLCAAAVDIRDCSELEAERLVDTMEGRGLPRYQGDRQEELDQLEHRWSFETR